MTRHQRTVQARRPVAEQQRPVDCRQTRRPAPDLRAQTPAAYVAAEARRWLPILRERLAAAERLAEKLYVMDSIRKKRVRSGLPTRGLPDYGPVENITDLRADIEWCERIVDGGIPSWAEIDEYCETEKAHRDSIAAGDAEPRPRGGWGRVR